MKIFSKRIISLLVLILALSSALVPYANAQAVASKEEAINSSTYYLPYEDKIILDEEKALSLNNQITAAEIKEIELYLSSLKTKQIDEILIDNGYDLEDVKVDEDVAHANIVWFVPVIIIALLVTGAIIFTGKYLSYKEKKNLVDKCYANKGYPVLDSRDKTGVSGSPKKGVAEGSGGYKFECRKK